MFCFDVDDRFEPGEPTFTERAMFVRTTTFVRSPELLPAIAAGVASLVPHREASMITVRRYTRAFTGACLSGNGRVKNCGAAKTLVRFVLFAATWDRDAHRRKRDGERRAAVDARALDSDAPALSLDDLLADGEAKSLARRPFGKAS